MDAFLDQFRRLIFGTFDKPTNGSVDIQGNSKQENQEQDGKVSIDMSGRIIVEMLEIGISPRIAKPGLTRLVEPNANDIGNATNAKNIHGTGQCLGLRRTGRVRTRSIMKNPVSALLS